jgi:site-specific recombinase XerD
LDRCLAVQADSPWGRRNRAMISLSYYPLARRSELVALQVRDIEFREDDILL